MQVLGLVLGRGFGAAICKRMQASSTKSLVKWTVCSTTANQGLSKTWCTILKTKRQNTLQVPSWPTELP